MAILIFPVAILFSVLAVVAAFKIRKMTYDAAFHAPRSDRLKAAVAVIGVLGLWWLLRG